jgi:DNA-binding GntR family transcriptional regulator
MNHLDLSRQYRLLHFYLRHLSLNTVEWHETLFDAICNHDEDMAETLARTGLESTAEGLIRSLQEDAMQGNAERNFHADRQKEG